jgi:hypothetical protein
VTAEQIIAYATACGETDPRWTEHGPELTAPPTFALSLRGRHFMPKSLPTNFGRNGFDAGKDIEIARRRPRRRPHRHQHRPRHLREDRPHRHHDLHRLPHHRPGTNDRRRSRSWIRR